jgi:hypothetical protein
MSLPRGSLGFLSEKVWLRRSTGRIRDRLRLGCPDGGQFALPEGDDHDRQPESDAQPIPHTKHGPATHTGSRGHLPRRS